MKYKHHTLGREAKHFETDTIANGYKIIDKNGLLVFGDNRTDKNTLFALGFQPVEETTNDWIDEACTEYMNNEALAFQNNNTFDTEKSFRQAIEKYVPKQELIPLDTDKVTEELMEGLFWEWQKDGSIGKIIKQIFSKYGTTPQKKFTRLEIEKVVGKYEKDSWDDYQAGKLKGAEEILIHMGLLEE